MPLMESNGTQCDDFSNKSESMNCSVFLFDLTESPLELPPCIPVNSPSVMSALLNDGPAVCRICHGGEFSLPFEDKNVGEPLISPCICSGSMSLCHRSCLEKWLETANVDRCEICRFVYMLERENRSVVNYLTSPNSSERRNLFADLTCLCVLTPLALLSTYMCAYGALAFGIKYGWLGLKVPGLFILGAFLIFTYTIWLVVSVRFHFSAFRDWQRTNQIVRVLGIDEVVKHVSPLGIEMTKTASPSSPVVINLDDMHTRSVHSSELLAGSQLTSIPQFDHVPRNQPSSIAVHFANDGYNPVETTF